MICGIYAFLTFFGVWRQFKGSFFSSSVTQLHQANIDRNVQDSRNIKNLLAFVVSKETH